MNLFRLGVDFRTIFLLRNQVEIRSWERGSEGLVGQKGRSGWDGPVAVASLELTEIEHF